MRATTQTRPHGILVIDDDEAVRHLYSEILQHASCRVQTAESVRQARRILEEDPIDVILCDHHLPDEEGLSFLSELRVRYPALQRILITGNSTEGLALRGINEARLDHFIRKPCPPKELVNKVMAVLEHRTLPAGTDPRHESARRSIISLFIMGLIALLALSLAAVLLFGVVYLLKWIMGIDLIPDFHLGDRL